MLGPLLRRLSPRLHFALKRRLGRLYDTEVQPMVLERYGMVVGGGPFMGMKYIARASGSALTPKIVGTYECELHEVIESAIARRYQTVIDIGCAEGYYAVGLALRLPGARIFAFDIDVEALQNLHDLARLNDVQDRIELGGRVEPEDLNRFNQGRCLVICDVEGEEITLLDPRRAPALRQHDIIVEIHDGLSSRRIRDALTKRFGDSHHLRFIPFKGRGSEQVASLEFLGHMNNRLRAVDEQRSRGLEWGYFLSKSSN